MLEYHKIQSVYMRDPATKHRTFLIGEWAVPAFGYLANNLWQWTEKIDGTNVRVVWNGAPWRAKSQCTGARVSELLTSHDVRKMLADECDYEGGIRAFARLAKISPGHISRVVRGEKEPGEKVLDWFGLEVVVRYRQK